MAYIYDGIPMKDRLILVAFLILIVLIALLLAVSWQRNRELSRAIERVQQTEVSIPEIDYPRLEQFLTEKVEQKVAGIPAPKDGQHGKDAVDGERGERGDDGESVYDLWLEAGNTGSIADFLASLQGEKGDRGPVPLLRFNSDTNSLESKLPTDLFWQVVPKVCEACP